MIKKKKIEGDKERFVRGLLIYLNKQKKTHQAMVGHDGRTSYHQGYENASHDIAQYVRQITKPKRIKK